jgi:hypothetical protein
MAEKDVIRAKFSAHQLQHVLQQTDGALQELEDELSDFLENYYARVGGHMKQLLELRRELKRTEQETFSSQAVPELSEAFMRLPANRLRETIKQLYHELARDCHPDLKGEEVPAERMQELNAAYNARNLSALWKLKWEVTQEKSGGRMSHKDRLDLYRTQVGHMQESLEALEARQEALKQSEAWQLLQHARFMKLSGCDFMEAAEKRICAEVEEARTALARARRQQHYWHMLGRSSSAEG